MIKIVVELLSYYSPMDEESYFSWLKSIPGYVYCQGVGRDLNVYFNEEGICEDTVYELIGIFSRYNNPMGGLAVLVSCSVGYLIEDRSRWWYSHIFGVE